MPSMLLSSPGDNPSSLSMDSGQKQTDIAETQRSIEGDRVQPDRAHLSPSNGIYADSSAAEKRIEVPSSGGTFTFPSLSQRQASRLPKASVHETELDGLYALRQAAGLNALRQARAGLLSSGTLAKLAISSTHECVEISSFAAPLSPLRTRDIQALSELFLRSDIYAIEADVNQRLLALLPEPCWEDEVFAFLDEFL